MRLTIAVRTDKALRDAVAERAAAQGKTVSAFVREILEHTITDRPLRARAGHLRGGLKLPQDADDAWRRHLRERNWRP